MSDSFMSAMPVKTRTIAGHTFTLTVGLPFRAHPPQLTGDTYSVDICEMMGPGVGDLISTKAEGLSLDDANTLVAEFNSGSDRFDGRVW